MKKLIALILCVSLLCPTMAFAETNSELTYDYSSSCEMNAEFNPDGYESIFASVSEPNGGDTSGWVNFYVDEFEDVLFRIKAYKIVTEVYNEYDETGNITSTSTLDSLWYQVRILEGNTPVEFADESWILQNYLGADADEYDTLILFEPDKCDVCGKEDCEANHLYCDVCKKYDCDIEHVQCEICDEYDCGKTHVWCSLCEEYDCGKTHTWCKVCEEYDCDIEHVQCEICNEYDCGKTHIWCNECEKYDCGIAHNKISGNITDSKGNIIEDLTITVSGDSLPVGAQVVAFVPEVDGQELPGVFDIKVLKADGTEWQPIDEGKTVTISIPVDTDSEYVNVFHYIDNPNAITEESLVFSAVDQGIAEFDIFQPAIAAYGDGEHFAIQLFYMITVNDSVINIETNSFSIYQWDDGAFTLVSSGSDQNVTFNNLAFGEENDLGDFYYYASPNQTFTLTTAYPPQNTDPFFLNVSETTVAYTTTTDLLVNNDEGLLSWTRSATFTVPGTATPGQKIVVDFVGGGGAIATVIVCIVDEVTITFDKNLDEATLTTTVYEGVVTDGDTSKKIFTIPEYTPTVPNDSRYTFKEWNTSPDGSGTSYLPNDSFTPLRDMTLYAIWSAENYFVDFNLMGGAGNVPEKTLYTDGSSITLPSAPTKANTTFLGWSVTSDGYSSLLPPDSAYTVNSDVTFYAIWGVDLTITVANGTLTLQKAGEFSPKSLSEHTYQDGTTKIFSNEGTDANGVTTYTATLVEGYLENAIFFFEHSESLNAAVASSNDEITIRKASTTQTQATISAVGIAKHSTITFDATQGQTYYISFDTAGGTSIAPIAKVQNSTFSKSEITETTIKLGYDFGEWLYNGSSFSSFSVTQNITLTATWTAHSYTVKLDSNGGNETYSDIVYTIEDGKTLPSPTKEGHIFAGWKVTVAGGSWATNGMYTGSFSGMYGDATLTAQWTLNSYTATWDIDGTKTKETYSYGATIIAPAKPEKVGYVFAGWNGYTDGMTMPASDKTFTATWSKIIYQVTFAEKNENSIIKVPEIGTNPLTFDIDSLPSEIPQPERTGYTFGGWYANAECTGTPYNAISLADELKAENETDLVKKTIYAKWTINTYTVVWENWDGTVLETDKNVPYGTMPSYDGATPTKAATTQYTYTFAGWNKKITEVSGDTTYYATYTSIVNTYTITFVDEDGTELQSSDWEYGSTPVYNGETPTKIKVGYTCTFSGWSPTVTAVTQNRTYTATYSESPITYTITYNLNGGTVNGTNPETYNIESENITLISPTKTGYTFTGWTGTDLTTADTTVTIVKGSTGNKSYTANWKINQYTIKFADTGDTAIDPITQDYATAISKPSDPTKTGYTFAGWDKSIPTTMPAKDMTITAKWTVNKYTIAYNLAGGTFAEGESNPTSYTIESEDITLINPTRAGYTFEGWTGTDLSAATTMVTIAKGSTGNKEYTAIWKEAYADLEITATCGDSDQTFIYIVSGSPDDTVTYGNKISLTIAIPAGKTVIIKDLPVGKYTVTEQSDWNWRYENQNESEFDFTVSGKSVTFTYSKIKTDMWLNDYYDHKKKGAGA